MSFFDCLLTAISGISLNNTCTILPLYFYLYLVHACTGLHEGVMVFHEWSQRENKCRAPDCWKEHIDTAWSLIMVRGVRHTTIFHDLLKS